MHQVGWENEFPLLLPWFQLEAPGYFSTLLLSLTPQENEIKIQTVPSCAKVQNRNVTCREGSPVICLWLTPGSVNYKPNNWVLWGAVHKQCQTESGNELKGLGRASCWCMWRKRRGLCNTELACDGDISPHGAWVLWPGWHLVVNNLAVWAGGEFKSL